MVCGDVCGAAGYLRATFSETFTFFLEVDGGGRLLLDGAPLIDCWSETDTSSKRASPRYSKFVCRALSPSPSTLTLPAPINHITSALLPLHPTLASAGTHTNMHTYLWRPNVLDYAVVLGVQRAVRVGCCGSAHGRHPLRPPHRLPSPSGSSSTTFPLRPSLACSFHMRLPRELATHVGKTRD